MELRYIQCRDGVIWEPKKQLIASLALLGKESFILKNGTSESGGTVYAHWCKKCKKIIIDYLGDAENAKEI